MVSGPTEIPCLSDYGPNHSHDVMFKLYTLPLWHALIKLESIQATYRGMPLLPLVQYMMVTLSRLVVRHLSKPLDVEIINM